MQTTTGIERPFTLGTAGSRSSKCNKKSTDGIKVASSLLLWNYLVPDPKLARFADHERGRKSTVDEYDQPTASGAHMGNGMQIWVMGAHVCWVSARALDGCVGGTTRAQGTSWKMTWKSLGPRGGTCQTSKRCARRPFGRCASTRGQRAQTCRSAATYRYLQCRHFLTCRPSRGTG